MQSETFMTFSWSFPLDEGLDHEIFANSLLLKNYQYHTLKISIDGKKITWQRTEYSYPTFTRMGHYNLDNIIFPQIRTHSKVRHIHGTQQKTISFKLRCTFIYQDLYQYFGLMRFNVNLSYIFLGAEWTLVHNRDPVGLDKYCLHY